MWIINVPRAGKGHPGCLLKAAFSLGQEAVAGVNLSAVASALANGRLTRPEFPLRRRAHGRKSSSGSEISSRTPNWVIAKSSRRSAWVISASRFITLVYLQFGSSYQFIFLTL